MQEEKKTTIYDIAKAAGTSTATVSRVLSHSGYPVKEELRQKIMELARQMDYSPNIIGRMLKKKVSLDIGVIIPTISNPFYPQVILGIETEARKAGYNILLCNSFRNASVEKEYLESLFQKQVRGLIISSIGGNIKLLKRMQENGVKVVAFDQEISRLSCSKVGFDYEKGARMAVEYLIRMGHRHIAFLSSPLNRASRKEVLEGYKQALLKAGIGITKENVIISETEEESRSGTYEFENGKKLALRLLQLETRPSAVFAVNDMTACGIIQELLSQGIRVPEDISVIGFDNIEISSMVHPPLTTINQPAFETGRLACKLLLDSLENPGAGHVSMMLEPELVVRESVAETLNE